MHDGSLPTLAAVVDHYADLQPKRRVGPVPISLTPEERRDLVAFLGTLDSAAR
jgi:cytochrome c peroxidase